MKKWIAALLVCSSTALAQWTDFSSLTASTNLSGAMNGKRNFQIVAGSPSGLACTAGKDEAWDTIGLTGYDCTVTGSPGTWVARVSVNGSYSNPSWITSLAGSKVTGLSYQTLKVGGSAQTQQPNLNLINGTNVTISCVNNGGTFATDCTVSATAGAGGYTQILSNGSSSGLTPRSNLNFSSEFTAADNSGAGRTDISMNSVAASKVTGLFYQTAGVNSTSQTQRGRLNLIPGTNVTITASDNSGTGSTDVTINSSAGGGANPFTANHAYTYTSGTLAVDFSTYTSVTVTPNAGGVNPTLTFTAPTSNLGTPLEFIACNFASGSPAVWTLPGTAQQIGVPVRAGDCVRNTINFNTNTSNFEGQGSTSTPSIIDLSAERAAPTLVPPGGSIYPNSTSHNVHFLNSSSVDFATFKAGQDCNPDTGQCTNGSHLTSGSTAVAQKFFGTTSPGSVSGNLPGDTYNDTTNHVIYTCNAPSGTSAPACTSVTTGGWTAATGPSTAHQASVILTCSGSASATAQTCTTSPSFTPGTGDVLWFTPGATNTGAFTLNVNSTSAASVFHNGAALIGCELTSGVPVSITFNGTQWTLPPAAITIATGTTTSSGAGSLNNLGSIASAGHATLTVTSSCVAATDVISFTPNASLIAVVGFVPATTGGIGINAYPGSGNVNFDASNWSTGALTIGTGAQLNWRVAR